MTRVWTQLGGDTATSPEPGWPLTTLTPTQTNCLV